MAGVIGAVMKQVPAFALHDPSAYAAQMAQIHATYDATMGRRRLVDLTERWASSASSRAPWFVFLLTLLVVSIICCTLDRTPDLWRKERLVRAVQPPPFYDLRMDNRALVVNVDEAALGDVMSVLRRSRFRVREQRVAEAAGNDVVNIYGDRNQYFKLATLFTHLGLILFLGAAALTTALSASRRWSSWARARRRPSRRWARPTTCWSRTSTSRRPPAPTDRSRTSARISPCTSNGELVARKVIRVNDPLEVDGFVFHQNTFGPAETLQITDPNGKLVWTGPVILDGELAGRPQGFMTIPGSKIGLLLVLDKDARAAAPLLALTGLDPEGRRRPGEHRLPARPRRRGRPASRPRRPATRSPGQSAGAYTGMVIKRDPGQGVIWLAYLSLITGLVLTFYFPRRRFWARYENGRLHLALLADRYVDAEREFEKIVDTITARTGSQRENPESASA